ncbi:MAG: hypothetical protein L3J42_05355 [Hydrogenimonas sp.]|nr:hypothetical protein [Hydrogenimonas sp.]
MKHIFQFLLLVLLTTSSAICDDMAKKVKIQNENVVKAAVEEFSKELPKRVDRFTRLTSVSADGVKIVYTFEISVPGKSDADLVKEGKEKMKKRVVAGTCRSSERFLKSGIVISYHYISAESGTTLFTYDVKRDDCPQIR